MSHPRRNREWNLKKLLSYAFALVALLLLAPTAMPASAGVGDQAFINHHPYAIWPPNYCATAAGTIYHTSSTVYMVYGNNNSQYAPSGTCNGASPAVAGTFAVQPKLESSAFGSWAACRSGTWVGNTTGQWVITSQSDLAPCGSSADHRLGPNAARITYGGTNFYDSATSSGV